MLPYVSNLLFICSERVNPTATHFSVFHKVSLKNMIIRGMAAVLHAMKTYKPNDCVPL